MRLEILLAGVVLLAMNCTPSQDSLKQQIIDTDLAFSAMSKEKGMKEAFIQYADDDVIKPNPNQQPVIGKNQLIQSFEGATLNFELTWEPIKAEVSGDIGYTFGNWYRKWQTADMRDTIVYGNYVSIWKRQKDGSWKYVLDTGNTTPGPTKLE